MRRWRERFRCSQRVQRSRVDGREARVIVDEDVLRVGDWSPGTDRLLGSPWPPHQGPHPGALRPPPVRGDQARPHCYACHPRPHHRTELPLPGHAFPFGGPLLRRLPQRRRRPVQDPPLRPGADLPLHRLPRDEGYVAEGGIFPRGHVPPQPLREGVGGVDGGGAERQARGGAQQRPRGTDGHPRPHGARANGQHPLHYQRNPRLARPVQLELF